jgi:uncharacterized membrane protein YgcG
MSAAVAIAAPSVALATHHKHHHARHHHSTRTHRRVRHERFGKSDQGQPSNAQQAGSVVDFTNGILTIAFTDSSGTTTTISGAVTDQTELECTAPAQQNQGDNDGDDNGGMLTNSRNDHGGGSSSGSGDDNGGSGSGDDNGGSGSGGDDGNQMCSTASLTPGAPVAQANLEITSAGASWDKVELITASSSTSSDN